MLRLLEDLRAVDQVGDRSPGVRVARPDAAATSATRPTSNIASTSVQCATATSQGELARTGALRCARTSSYQRRARRARLPGGAVPSTAGAERAVARRPAAAPPPARASRRRARPVRRRRASRDAGSLDDAARRTSATAGAASSRRTAPTSSSASATRRRGWCSSARGPARDEDVQGEPFVGRAGQLLTEIITKGMKLRREDVYIANVIKCRPPENRNPEPDEIATLRAVPPAPARADRAGGDRRARQVRGADAAAHRRRRSRSCAAAGSTTTASS